MITWMFSSTIVHFFFSENVLMHRSVLFLAFAVRKSVCDPHNCGSWYCADSRVRLVVQGSGRDVGRSRNM